MMSSHARFTSLRSYLEQVIVGQHSLLDRLMISLLTGGHILLEAAPGLAKTTAVKTLASGVHASFQRIQFTPDLMPGDITGSEVLDPGSGAFRFLPGPLFHEIILADEINRAPPKVQAALLEAMQEHQVTVGGETHPLPELFLVMATQNPLEQSGTYPLPEAQLDRFLLHVVLDYPDADEELLILKRDHRHHFSDQPPRPDTPLQPADVLAARAEIGDIHIEEALERYIVDLVQATRRLSQIDEGMGDYLQAGASPRASIALLRAASAHAWLQGRDYLMPEDIVEMTADVLRHRIVLNYAAIADGVGKDDIIERIVAEVPVP